MSGKLNGNDSFENVINAKNMIRGETGVVYDELMADHRCLWDDKFVEGPERFTRIIERCNELNLLSRCKRIPSRKATKEEALTKHSEKHYNLLKSTTQFKDVFEFEEFASKYEAIYFHPNTFDVSLLALGCTLNLVDNILNGKVQNGMAIIRPPGHHAMKTEFNGLCYLNNVAIAAQIALDKHKLNRILIIDWDVHHGQGTQRFFYNDPRVVYFSIHRFGYGKYWPCLRESDYDYIGEDSGKGFNFNLPLNQEGMKNGDYMAIFQQILLPIAFEFQPELVLISAGYDSALGCPEGRMEITPAFYPHLLNPLMSLAQGRVAVVLEGGYCVDSLAEGASLTLRTLLGDPCPIVETLKPPCDSIQDAILNCIHAHRPYWKSLQIQKTYNIEELNRTEPEPNLHKVIQIYQGERKVPERYPTRDWYPKQNEIKRKIIEERLKQLKLSTNLSFARNRACYVYADLISEQNSFNDCNPEYLDRLRKIKERHIEYGVLERMQKINSRHATTDEICLVHTRSYVNLIRKTVKKSESCESNGDSSFHFHPKTFESSTLAAGSVLQVIDNIFNGMARSGVCLVQPPGHHANSNLPQGLCIFNNIAIAANYAIRNHGLKRILIIDWDVHHGNGTQDIFESNPNVLYISLHRYDDGNFKSKDANYDILGKGEGEGFNVNIPWNKNGMGDMEYVLAFQNIVMPIAYEYNPELVLISAGFDASIGDPLGGCKVTPEAYGYFTHCLSALANGKVVVCLEGGYNVNSISYAMTMCSKALLGDPLPILNTNYSSASTQSCIETIQNVLSIQQKYWKSLRFNKKLPEFYC